MRRTILFFILNILLITTLTSCYDAHEVTEWAYAYSIGMEKGVTDKLRMSVQIPTVKGEKGGGGGQEGAGGDKADVQEKGEYVTITIDCPTFYSGVNMINSFLPREINYMHTKYLVFSESLAREGIDTYITAFIRGRQIRRGMYMIVTKGSASEFLKENTVVLGSELSKKQENLLSLGDQTGFFAKSKYGNIINDIKTPYTQPIAILAAVNDFGRFTEGEGKGDAPFKTSGDYYAGDLVRKGGSKAEFFGTAVFNGGRMVGQLNGDETRAMLMSRGEFGRGLFAVKDPKKTDVTVTMDIRQQKGRSVKIRFEGDKPIVELKIFLEGDIRAIQTTYDYESKELKPLLENEFNKLIKKELDKTIKKCQGLNADIFKFGSVAAMKFGTIQEFEQYNWLKRFKDATVNTQVEFTIRRTGTMLKSSEFYTVEDKNGGENK